MYLFAQALFYLRWLASAGSRAAVSIAVGWTRLLVCQALGAAAPRDAEQGIAVQLWMIDIATQAAIAVRVHGSAGARTRAAALAVRSAQAGSHVTADAGAAVVAREGEFPAALCTSLATNDMTNSAVHLLCWLFSHPVYTSQRAPLSRCCVGGHHGSR